MRSRKIIEWCGRLNLITKKQYDQITELNKIRNSCAHNWILDIAKYKKTRSNKRLRTPVVKFNGKNLLNKEVFYNEFMPIYSKLYLKLLGKDWRIKDYI